MTGAPRPPRLLDAWQAGQPPPSPPAWQAGDVSFGDVLSALNPLQYLPGVGMIYRAVTGESTHPALQLAVAGATSLLFGGPIGLAATMLAVAGTELWHAVPAHPAVVAQAHRAYAHATEGG